jgi:hypothetical protein
MLKSLYLVAVPLIPLAWAQSSLSHNTKATQASVDVGCEIRTTKVPGGEQLEGVVFARKPAAGEYEFVVSKSGGGGTSNSSQSGDFELGARQESVVGEVTLGGGGSAKAHLTVRWSGGEASCSE